MSKLSAQCDELRQMAESVGLAMPQAATLMMEAADTITELRGALQVASADYRHLQAERDKLRDENQSIGMAAYELGHNSMADENAKLRELARAAWKCIHTGASCSDCRLIAGGCTLQTAMCELGVGVD